MPQQNDDAGATLAHSNKVAHDAAVSVSQGALQTELKASTTDAGNRTAMINHYHRLAQASHAYGVHNGSQEALASRFGITALPANEQEPAS